MDPRGTKRKHSESVQDGLVVELTKLNNDSANLNSDMKAANEDFAMMYKSMTDRQAEILTRGLFLEEQHRRVIELLNRGEDVVGVTSTGDEERARTSGNTDIRKLARESDESLRDHRV
ncbi:hypothetical protein DCAR_0728410 [Daucus carota subsp. sativus]|uniref:Uncharacterized protein n=1 Tax=Daucus carota subsp. sativus TaxID=79200 RepID=A0A161ZMW6_DAUCS|nr:hypothetical protein DCAR_0728410 [Daucus carota subsp. sativus]